MYSTELSRLVDFACLRETLYLILGFISSSGMKLGGIRHRIFCTLSEIEFPERNESQLIMGEARAFLIIHEPQACSLWYSKPVNPATNTTVNHVAGGQTTTTIRNRTSSSEVHCQRELPFRGYVRKHVFLHVHVTFLLFAQSYFS